MSYDCGVYQVRHLASGDRYIGASKNLRTRFEGHRSRLKHQHHQNSRLQAAWTRYGPEAFEFKILEFCEVVLLREREQAYLNALRPAYNIAQDVIAPMRGLKASEETRAKMRSALRGIKKTFSPEGLDVCRKNLAAMHARGLSYRTIAHSEATKAKISATKKGQPWTQARRDAQKRRG